MKYLKGKYIYLYLFFLLMFLLLGFRYFQVQLLMGDKQFEELLKRFKNVHYITLPGWRGFIYTSDGVPVAITVDNFVYYAIVDKLREEDKELYAERFDTVFDIPKGVLLKILSSRKEGYLKVFTSPDREILRKFQAVRRQLWKEELRYIRKGLGRRLSDSEKIHKLCAEGPPYPNGYIEKACSIERVLYWTGAERANKRVYPHGRFLANVLGFTSSSGRGRSGVEQLADKYLYTGPIKIAYEYGPLRNKKVGFYGLRLTSGALYPLVEKNLSADVYLTIDYTVQAILEEVKEEIVKRWNPKKVAIILMDIHTGAILGQAVYPDFDPNRPFRNWQEFLSSKNIAYTDVFEMGSVIKPFFVGLALYKGRIKETDKVYIDGGKTRIGRHTVSDAERLGKKYLTPREVLIYSSNVGTVQIARHLKKEDEEELIDLLGWNRKIVPFAGATKGLIPNLNLPANRLYIAFGQGLALTPLHLVSSYAALLTGFAPVPQYIKKVIREDGKVLKEFKPQYINDKPLFDERTREWLKETLRRIVMEGTGTKANPYYYLVGGKTGTAQVYDKKLHRYSSTRYVTSFIGFFPYKEPKYVLLVMVDEPKAPRRYLLYGGTVAGPYWAEIVNRVSSYLGLEPNPDVDMLKRKKW